MKPVVTLLGAGPGDPELLTVKAVKALRRATVALVDDLVDPGVLRYLKRGARVVPVGKRGGCASTPQAFIHKLMVAEALKGERVVRIKGGDPFVFGRGGEECDALRAAGVEVEVISGLTAGIAGPAALGIPVTDRRHAPGVALVTGHSQDGGHGPDWPALARSGLTLVVYMGVARVGAIVDGLRRGGLPGPGPRSARRCGGCRLRLARRRGLVERRRDPASPAGVEPRTRRASIICPCPTCWNTALSHGATPWRRCAVSSAWQRSTFSGLPSRDGSTRCAATTISSFVSTMIRK